MNQENTIIEIFKWLISGIILGIFIIAGVAILEMDDRIGEQNKILKEMVIAIQEQTKATQEQNDILNYNPMEEDK